MYFRSFFSKDIRDYTSSHKWRPTNTLTHLNIPQLCLLCIAMVICISLIITIIILYSKCHQATQDIEYQTSIINHQQDIIDDIQYRANSLQLDTNKAAEDIIDKDTSLASFKHTYERSLQIKDNEVSSNLNALQEAIHDARNKQDYLITRINNMKTSINNLDTKHNEYQTTKKQLLTQIDILEQQIKLKENTEYSNSAVIKYGSVLIKTTHQYDLLKDWIGEPRGIRLTLKQWR